MGLKPALTCQGPFPCSSGSARFINLHLEGKKIWFRRMEDWNKPHLLRLCSALLWVMSFVVAVSEDTTDAGRRSERTEGQERTEPGETRSWGVTLTHAPVLRPDTGRSEQPRACQESDLPQRFHSAWLQLTAGEAWALQAGTEQATQSRHYLADTPKPTLALLWHSFISFTNFS